MPEQETPRLTVIQSSQNESDRISKIKTDKLDAIKLADLLRGGYIAECYIPNLAVYSLMTIL